MSKAEKYQLVVRPHKSAYKFESGVTGDAIKIKTLDGGRTWELAVKKFGRWEPPEQVTISTEEL